LLTHLDPKARLKVGDRLVVCGEPRVLDVLLTQGKDEEPPHLRWAGTIRRFGRMAWRTLTEIDLAVKVCTSILILVVFASTLVFTLWSRSQGGSSNSGVADSLYRTISLIATGADMRGDRYHDELKIFVSVLRIVGAALTAAFTAIVTNYL